MGVGEGASLRTAPTPGLGRGVAGREGPESAFAWLGSSGAGGTEEERRRLRDPGWSLFGLGAEYGVVT